jgi:hypothetical protein
MNFRMGIVGCVISAVVSASCGGNGSLPSAPSSVSSPATAASSDAVAMSGDERFEALGGKGGGGGKPGGGGTTTGGSGSLSLVMVWDANSNGLPNRGDRITFTVSTSATSPFVSVNCYQGSNWVYASSVGFFPSYPWAQEFTLSASSWPSGSASCTARLYTSTDGIRTTTLSTMSFTALE